MVVCAFGTGAGTGTGAGAWTGAGFWAGTGTGTLSQSLENRHILPIAFHSNCHFERGKDGPPLPFSQPGLPRLTLTSSPFGFL
jgi:hypothetical protein